MPNDHNVGDDPHTVMLLKFKAPITTHIILNYNKIWV